MLSLEQIKLLLQAADVLFKNGADVNRNRRQRCLRVKIAPIATFMVVSWLFKESAEETHKFCDDWKYPGGFPVQFVLNVVHD